MTRPIVDRDSAHWWNGLCQHQLLLQRCNECRTLRWPPRALCNHCESFEWSWDQASGDARIVSWTVSHRSFQAELGAPYTVVLVRLCEADNLILPGGWDGAAGADLEVDQTVEASYRDYPAEAADNSFTLLNWRPKRL